MFANSDCGDPGRTDLLELVRLESISGHKCPRPPPPAAHSAIGSRRCAYCYARKRRRLGDAVTAAHFAVDERRKRRIAALADFMPQALPIGLNLGPDE